MTKKSIYLSVSQAAVYLGLTPAQVTARRINGQLEGTEVPSTDPRSKGVRTHYHFSFAALDKYKEEEKARRLEAAKKEAQEAVREANRRPRRTKTQPTVDAPNGGVPSVVPGWVGELVVALERLTQRLDVGIQFIDDPADAERRAEFSAYRKTTTDLLTAIRGGIEINNTLLERLVKGLGA